MPYPQWYVAMAPAMALHRVTDVRAIDGSDAPPEIRDRFFGRQWTLLEL